MNTISPASLQTRLESQSALTLLDVRTPPEFQQMHVPRAELVPLDRLDPADLTVKGHAKSIPLFLICRTGSRAQEAASRLETAGYEQCYVVEGGTIAWEEAGLPLDRGASKVISLERQVRIAAGAIVVVGVVLAQLVHPLFMGLSAFVGCGLIFAGLTDRCGMGMLIAKAPWNQL